MGPDYVDDLVERDDNSSSGNLGITGSGLGRRLYVQHDANWNITAITDTAGAVKQRFIYDPYGTRTVLTAAWASTSDGYNWLYSFQGGRMDTTSGLINFRNRWYSPTLGRWVQRDPTGAEYVDGMNLYQAESSAPVSAVDPLGMETMEVRYDLIGTEKTNYAGFVTKFTEAGTGASAVAIDLGVTPEKVTMKGATDISNSTGVQVVTSIEDYGIFGTLTHTAPIAHAAGAVSLGEVSELDCRFGVEIRVNFISTAGKVSTEMSYELSHENVGTLGGKEGNENEGYTVRDSVKLLVMPDGNGGVDVTSEGQDGEGIGDVNRWCWFDYAGVIDNYLFHGRWAYGVRR